MDSEFQRKLYESIKAEIEAQKNSQKDHPEQLTESEYKKLEHYCRPSSVLDSNLSKEVSLGYKPLIDDALDVKDYERAKELQKRMERGVI